MKSKLTKEQLDYFGAGLLASKESSYSTGIDPITQPEITFNNTGTTVTYETNKTPDQPSYNLPNFPEFNTDIDNVLARLAERDILRKPAPKAATSRTYYSPPDFDYNDEGREEEEEVDEERGERVRGLTLSSPRRRGDKMSTGDTYQKYIDNLVSLYKLYKDSGDLMYLYRIIIANFRKYFTSAYGYDPDHKRRGETLEEYVQIETTSLVSDFLQNKLCKIEDKNTLTADIHKTLTTIYKAPIQKKVNRVGVITLELYEELIDKFLIKGVRIDPSIQESIKVLNFKNLLSEGKCFILVYIPTLNIVLSDQRGYDNPIELLMSLSYLYKELDKLPDIGETKTLDKKNIITIDGIDFSKSAFESITECSYKTFISNLKLETLMENKEIAENSAVDVESKLI